MALPIHYSNDEKELIRHFIQRGDVPICTNIVRLTE